jgi:hypothetical protein
MQASKEAITKAAIDLVILDAIEKKQPTVAELSAYMKTPTFDKAVKGYVELFEKEAKNK